MRDSHGGQPFPPPNVALLTAAITTPPFPLAASTPPALSITADGWISGPGTKRNPTNISSGSGWHYGHPIGVLNHFTAGCGDPHDTLVSRGVSAHGCTLQDATLVQYVPFTRLSWHAYDQAYYTVGWENAALPGVCDWDVAMLARLAQLNAEIVKWVKDTYGFDIPVQRSPGWGYVPGIKCHADGLAPGSPWDPKGHWDAPWKATGDPISSWVSSGELMALDRSPWSSAQFIDAVKAGGDTDVTTDAEKAVIAQAKAYLDALTGDIKQTKDKTKPASAEGAGHRVARVVIAAEAPPPPAKRP